MSEQVKDGAEELGRLGPAVGREHRRGEGTGSGRPLDERGLRVWLDVTHGSVCCSFRPAVNFSGIWWPDGYLLGSFQLAMAGILTAQKLVVPPLPATPWPHH